MLCRTAAAVAAPMSLCGIRLSTLDYVIRSTWSYRVISSMYAISKIMPVRLPRKQYAMGFLPFQKKLFFLHTPSKDPRFAFSTEVATTLLKKR